MNKAKLVWALGIVVFGLAACDSEGGSGGKAGGAGSTAGNTNAGGATSAGGTINTGGIVTGGATGAGGTISTGGIVTGRTSSTGGIALAGTTNAGGTVSVGGIVTGGTTVAGGTSGGAIVATGGATGGSRADAGIDAPVDSPEAGRDASATRDGASDTSVNFDAAPDIPGDSATDSGAGSGLWSMGYYAGYDSTSYPVSAIEWAGMTHIAVAFYSPTATGAFDESLSQGSAAQGATLGHAIVTAAHAHGVKAVASLGGADSRAQFLAATASGVRDTFVGSFAKLATDYGYDGIDFDWESLENSRRASACGCDAEGAPACARLAAHRPGGDYQREHAGRPFWVRGIGCRRRPDQHHVLRRRGSLAGLEELALERALPAGQRDAHVGGLVGQGLCRRGGAQGQAGDRDRLLRAVLHPAGDRP